MFHRRGYDEIVNSKPANVRNFLDESPAYKKLVNILYKNLSSNNKEIYEALCAPASFEALNDEFMKIVQQNKNTKSQLQRFFTSFYDDNEKFDYYFIQLRDEYDNWNKKSEKAALV